MLGAAPSFPHTFVEPRGLHWVLIRHPARSHGDRTASTPPPGHQLGQSPKAMCSGGVGQAAYNNSAEAGGLATCGEAPGEMLPGPPFTPICLLNTSWK